MTRIFNFLQKQSSFILFCLFLFLNFLLFLQIFSNLNQKFLTYFFNSDSLYLPSIYRDLFLDHTGLNGWHLNAAPNIIPEWPLYFLVRFACGNFKMALVVYSALQFSLITLLICWIYRTVTNHSEWIDLILINLTLTLFLLIYFYSNDIYFGCIFLPGYHNGAFILALTSIALTFSYLKSGKRWWLFLLFITVFAATISDRLYMVMYSIPLLLLLFISPAIEQRKKLLFLSIGVVTSSLTGLAVFRLIQLSNYLHIISLDWKLLNIRNIIPSIRMFLVQVFQMVVGGGARSIIACITILVSLLGLWQVPRMILRVRPISVNGKKMSVSLLQQFQFFSFCMVICTILNPLINGSYVSFAIFRYLIYAFYYAVFFAFFLLLNKVRDIFLSKNAFTVVAAVVVGMMIIQITINASRSNNDSGFRRITGYYPEQVREMDHIAREHNLKYGIAGYWAAKKTTMFSKTSLRVYCVFNNLRPWYHVTNRNWYYDYSSGKFRHPEFNFIIGSSLEAGSDIKRIFQNDIDTIRSGDLVVYKVPPFKFDPEELQPVLIH